ncbi:MAG TPA: hypothetical protein VM261_06780 [Kofleriaceae bacterium]|nr:hypothetical protein [Kofleriaceae bacterium]
MDTTRIQELRRYQANSRRIQEWSLRGLVAGVVLGLLAAIIVSPAIGLPIAAIAAIVGGAGWWITRGHIEEFEQQLRAGGRR